MTSPSPLLYDTYYHIYNRGNNRENIFVDDSNYPYFMKLYAKYIQPVAETFAYCLLKNHFHALVRVRSEQEIKQGVKVSSPNAVLIAEEKPLPPDYVSQQFSNLFNAYAKAINKAYNRTGGLFQHPFGRVAVTSDAQFVSAVRYIHQNPQKHKFVDDFRDWKWSSYQTILSEKPTRLNQGAVLGWFGNQEAYIAMHIENVEAAGIRWFTQDDD